MGLHEPVFYGPYHKALHEEAIARKRRLSPPPSCTTVQHAAPPLRLNYWWTPRLVELTRARTTRISPRHIIRVISVLTDAHVDKIVSSSRHANLLRARFACVYLMRILLGFEFPRIGQWLGGKDPSTAHHAFRRASCLIESEPEFADIIQRARDLLSATGEFARLA